MKINKIVIFQNACPKSFVAALSPTLHFCPLLFLDWKIAHVPDPADSKKPDPSGREQSTMEEFAGLYGAHQRAVVMYLSSLLPTQADVDDVLQEASVVLWREFSTFQSGTNFRAWAFRVAFNQVRAWRKKQQRDRLLFSEEFLTAIAEELNAEQEFFDRRLQLMSQCLESLPPRHRELLALRYHHGHSVDVLAERFGKSIDAVYRLLSRVRTAVHHCIDMRLNKGELT
jgi:RNA polymerase sigma-70 factor (ECF subfamily)